MWSDVVCEFYKWDEFCPIVLLKVTEDSEVLFQFLVDPFCFAIGLWVIGGAK